MRAPLIALTTPIAIVDTCEGHGVARDRVLALAGLDDARLRNPLARFHLVEIAEATRLLAVSRRTLQRRLREQGLSFSGLADDVRRERAAVHLAASHGDVAATAAAVGFSEERAFRRAFVRWTGRTPTGRLGRGGARGR
jgi:AraC-like DNA-binding protein